MTFQANRSIGDLAFEVFASLSKQLRKFQKKAMEDNNAEDTHQLRVTLRKMRAALKLFEQVVVIDWVGDKKLSKIARSLGRKRDNDVLMQKFREVTVAIDHENEFIAKVNKALNKREKKAVKGIKSILDSKKFQKLLKSLDDWIKKPTFSDQAAKPLANSIGSLLENTRHLTKTHKALRMIHEIDLEEDAKSLFDKRTGDTIHDLRKCAKQLRYQMEFVSPGKDRPNLALDLLRMLQDALGKVQDMRVLKIFLDESFGKSWEKKLRGVSENILADIRANLFEARKIAPHLHSAL